MKITENLRKVIVPPNIDANLYLGWSEDSEYLNTIGLASDGKITQETTQELLWMISQGEVVDPGAYEIPEAHLPALFAARWAVGEVFSEAMPLAHAWKIFKVAAWGMHGEELEADFPMGDPRPLLSVVAELLASSYSRAAKRSRPAGGEEISPRHIAMRCENDIITLTAGWGISEVILRLPRCGFHESEVRVTVVAPGAGHRRAVVAREKWQELTASV